jgi:hypothetical protein
MISPAEEEYIVRKAYVPEHVVSLMVPISKGEPFLREEHVGFKKDNWVILIGYPLDEDFSEERCERVVKQALEAFRPEYLWFIGPGVPPLLAASFTERQTDQYYKIDLEKVKLRPSLERVAARASQDLTVDKGRTISREHRGLIKELLKRETLPPRLKELYGAMPDYVAASPDACVLDARDKNRRLVAFIVVDLGARNFSTYVLGTHSKKHYVAHASDLLFLEMIKLTRGQGKSVINLGLGVNSGIRRFKEKWGGVPFLSYEFCECTYKATRTLSLIKSIEGKL